MVVVMDTIQRVLILKNYEMNYKLTYTIGKRTVQEWYFHSKSLAYWMKSELLIKGGYDMGKFKVEEL